MFTVARGCLLFLLHGLWSAQAQQLRFTGLVVVCGILVEPGIGCRPLPWKVSS